MGALHLFWGLVLSGTAIAGPEADGDAESFPRVEAYGAFVGGGAYEAIDRRTEADVVDPSRVDELTPDERENRFWTPALARIGMAGKLSPHFTFQSEVEFNAGPYGTSVWEGQAAIQVRNQLIRLQKRGVFFEGDRLRLEVGRLTDPASVNFVSVHTANLLLSDELARASLLVAGFNRGNGVRLEYAPVEPLAFGLTANAGNPTSTTSTLAIGGTFPPFARFYQVPWSVVGRDARGFPQSSFHSMVLTPSVRLTTDVLQAQFAAQVFSANTNTFTRDDEQISGLNLRGGLRLNLADGAFSPFVNASRMVNDVVELTDLATLADGLYLGSVLGGGFDVNTEKVGFGAQYDLVYQEERGEPPSVNHFVNAGVSVGLAESVFLSGRFALVQVCETQDLLERCQVDGRRQGMLTITAVLGASQDVQP